MGTAFIVRYGVDLVDDHRAGGLEHGAAPIRGQQDEQGFGSGDQNVRRGLRHLLALVWRGVAGPDSRPNRPEVHAPFLGEFPNLGQRSRQVLLDVVAESLERGYVDHRSLVGERIVARGANQRVQANQECRQGLAGARRRRDQDVVAGRDRLPALDLGLRGAVEPALEPLGHQRIEVRQRHRLANPI